MKLNIFSLFVLAAMGLGVVSCDTEPEAMEVQKLTTYDEQYYENLRAYKKSDHEVSFAYYEGWSPIEGVEGYKDPASWGERMVGLPDSIDIVNLWMGIPTEETHPIAYRDMKYCQEKLGTRFVMHADASHYRHKFVLDGDTINMGGQIPNDSIMALYAKWILQQVDSAGLDGVDIDYEGWSPDPIGRLCVELNKTIGPGSPNPDKLLIVDYFGSVPPQKATDVCDYVVHQSYSNQTSMNHPSTVAPEKMIYCESFGVFYATGGQLLNYARWEPGNGHRKGGCGVFYLGRNYYSSSGIPYHEFRQAIQIMNPAIHK